MKVLLVMSVMVIYFSDSVYSYSIDNLLDTLSRTWESITDTWNNVVDKIKKPVRIRRLGSIGKRKRTTTSATNTPLFSIPFPSKLPSSPNKAASLEMPPELRKIKFPEWYQVTAPGEGKLKLPYIPEPIWKTLEDWKKMQMPHFVKIVRGENDRDFEAITDTEYELSDIPETEKFGPLMFV